ncbi:RNA polymerase-associated protein RapA [Alkalimarinus sediminis]|uniref:RNA polymerase-associated protein RapA n=1 Tax=Alkalimarinus sediminis TaxID=1632866 RepID=A0A9E8HIB7_9ALTE|nr:RNA polymerase-associated protein RapA [Alkalimarinus sediminis]UZW75195.1 RNA polymerase-associated protein RapA [Alkalimarinus sediminis]
MQFILGQRWVSHTESKLGLGIISEVNGRRITVSFPAVGEERTYAADNAPLSRLIYNEGEQITTLDDLKYHVTSAEEVDGIYIYHCEDEEGNGATIEELDLSCFVQLTAPQHRLFSGHFDKNKAFTLRIETLNHIHRLQQSSVKGLLGARTNHLPHQVYIANEVAQRFAPRVLLADEVGLGKTIEAGMILHYQIHTGRAKRALIVVPDSLIHQWLVEMLRRFNLAFSIFDQSRYDALTQSNNDEGDEFAVEADTQSNPFETEQLVLCSLDFLTENPAAKTHAVEASWDLLTVDEAHHLHWSETEASIEYQCVEQLASNSAGLLLLTATPEQVGIESHFARLRLLDPSRFYDLERFKQEEAGYQPLNLLVQQLVELQSSGAPISPELLKQLGEFTDVSDAQDIEGIIARLLDQHGTGRVLFRNTRAAIKGFPQRKLSSYPLPVPALYQNHTTGITGLYPEVITEADEWIQSDPRVSWLEAKLKQLKSEKVLVICANASTAVALEQYLQLRAGIRSAAFYEGLSIIERDRASAYFAETEGGAQTLICSEIGSEGRNFQFAHHLVLFDLPLNPDLLEQRIGRLDRIGQTETIQIHVPYLEATSQESLFRWYHEGINLFEQSCSVGYSIYEQFELELLEQLQVNDGQINALIADTAAHTEKMRQLLHEGRDQLLELNSCKLPQAEAIISTIEEEEDSPLLEEFMMRLFNQFGVDQEHHSDHAHVIRPSDHMFTSHFPGLKDDGNTITFSREKALSREDMEFLSWEHPMVVESMEMVQTAELGNATVATISVKGLQPGTLLLETYYTVNCIAPKQLQVDRFLPITPIRVMSDVNGRDLGQVLPHERLNGMCEKVKRNTAQAIVKQVRHDIEKMLTHATTVAEQALPDILNKANEKMMRSLKVEVDRLEALQAINPAIRDEEISFFKQQISASADAINRSTVQLQAIRVVVTN